MLTKEKILEVISAHADPKIITGIVIKGSRIGFALESQSEDLRLTCEKAVFALSGVEKVTAVLTGKGGAIVSENKQAPALNRQQPVAGVKKIIAIAAGKGGVGKSTLAVNLAHALSGLGVKVGLVDADIYGPSLPRMMGISGKPQLNGNFIKPHVKNGIECNSIGFMVAEADAAIWRGPMATKALHQLIRGTSWDVDILLIDMPPGTGDIQLSIAQNYPVDGAVIISTPQEIALLDVRKAAAMFQRVGTKILGVVENMSYFEDSQGVKNYIFGESGVGAFAASVDAPVLAQIPLHPAIRENADNGILQSRPEFVQVAQNLLKQF